MFKFIFLIKKNFLLILILILISCSADEKILPGKRKAVIDYNLNNEINYDIYNEDPGFESLFQNKMSGHPGVNNGHSGGHLKLDFPLKKIWKTKISGSKEDFIKLPQPVIANNLVYVVGYNAIISAYNINNGDYVWGTIIEENPDEIFPGLAGGLATNGQFIAVHASRKNLLLLDAKTGKLKWLIEHKEPLAGGPTFLGNKSVAVTDLDGKIFVYDLDNGSILWQRVGIYEDTVYFGASSPAYNNNEVVLVGSSGDVSVHNGDDGDLIWADNIVNSTPITPLQEFGDIVSHPIHDGKNIIVVSQSGSLSTYNAKSGFLKWEFKISSSQMPWVSGKTIFVLSDDNNLFSIRKSDGMIRWKSVVDNSTKSKYVGPILASNKIILISDNGKIKIFDAKSGKKTENFSIKGPVLISPQIAEGTLVVINNNGLIQALR